MPFRNRNLNIFASRVARLGRASLRAVLFSSLLLGLGVVSFTVNSGLFPLLGDVYLALVKSFTAHASGLPPTEIPTSVGSSHAYAKLAYRPDRYQEVLEQIRQDYQRHLELQMQEILQAIRGDVTTSTVQGGGARRGGTRYR